MGFDIQWYNETTLNELLIKYYNKINELVDIHNTCLEFMEEVKNIQLPIEVKNYLNEMYENGKLTEYIQSIVTDFNNSLLTINEKLNVSNDLNNQANINVEIVKSKVEETNTMLLDTKEIQNNVNELNRQCNEKLLTIENLLSTSTTLNNDVKESLIQSSNLLNDTKVILNNATTIYNEISNKPICKKYFPTDVQLTPNYEHRISWNNILFSTNDKFTIDPYFVNIYIPKPGYYKVECTLVVASTDRSFYCQAYARKNANEYIIGDTQYSSNSGYTVLHLSGTYLFTSTDDYITIGLFHSNVNNVTLKNDSRIEVEFVRGV